MKKIGYMDGTDSFLLTKLAAAGVETVPLGNGFDNAGRYIGYLNPSDGVEAVVGYFHKFLPLKGSNVCASDLLKPCAIHNIPVFVLVPKEDAERAKKIMGECGPNVKSVDPGEVADELMKLIE
ncbi:MAG: hypothetical protein GTN49_11780 [candidate division Zixibacteria bacterium]|nr:hypothetical protein [candidate division Zixibacteria bacterium]